MSKLSKYLIKLRKEISMTIIQVAKESGISQTYLYKLEQGLRSKPSAETLRRLAKAYGISVVEIFLRFGYLEESDLYWLPKRGSVKDFFKSFILR